MHELMTLPGSAKNSRPLKTCDKCNTPSEQSAGVQLSQAKWICFKCWRLKQSRKSK